MLKKKRRFLNKNRENEDPLSGMANVTDVMLVLSVGFLIFAIMSMNMQSIIFNDLTQKERKELSEAIKDTVAVKTGKNFNGSVDVKDGENEGMEKMGVVYKDQNTGKLIMIPPKNQNST